MAPRGEHIDDSGLLGRERRTGSTLAADKDHHHAVGRRGEATGHRGTGGVLQHPEQEELAVGHVVLWVGHLGESQDARGGLLVPHVVVVVVRSMASQRRPTGGPGSVERVGVASVLAVEPGTVETGDEPLVLEHPGVVVFASAPCPVACPVGVKGVP